MTKNGLAEGLKYEPGANSRKEKPRSRFRYKSEPRSWFLQMTQELVIKLAERMAGKRPRAAAGFARRGRRRFRAPVRGRKAADAIELKFHDLDVDQTGVATAGNIAEDSCVTIAQGTTESERIGRKCTIRQINWRFELLLPGATGSNNTSDIVRIILYQDKQCNGATAAVTGILESADYQSFNQLANKSRFRTLMDRTYELSSGGGSGRGSTDTLAFAEKAMQDTFFKKVNIPIEYDNSATTGVITSVRTNNIGVLTISKEELTNFRSKMRLRFSDN